MSAANEKRLGKPGSEKIAPVEIAAYIGLCSTCNNSLTCVYRKARGGPAIYCETFDGTTLETSPAPSESVSKEAVMTSKDNWEKHKGLCVNCEYRAACAHAGSTEGVWHCEEYLLEETDPDA